MQMLTAGVGTLSEFVGPGLIRHTLVGASAIFQGVGGSYANIRAGSLTGSKITSGAVCALGSCAGNNGSIVVPGIVVSSMFSELVTVTGFPWTTGIVSVTATDFTSISTFTGSGDDGRTPLGSGIITLVAGGLTHRFRGTVSALDTVQITLSPRQHLPSFSTAGLTALAAALTLSMGYVHRRRSLGR